MSKEYSSHEYETCMLELIRTAPDRLTMAEARNRCRTKIVSTDEEKSLKAFGKMIDILKLDLEDGRIKDMTKLLEDDPETFYRYGVRDSVIKGKSQTPKELKPMLPESFRKGNQSKPIF